MQYGWWAPQQIPWALQWILSWLISCMCLQDEEGWVDAELSMAQVADLQVNSETVTGSSAFVS